MTNFRIQRHRLYRPGRTALTARCSTARRIICSRPGGRQDIAALVQADKKRLAAGRAADGARHPSPIPPMIDDGSAYAEADKAEAAGRGGDGAQRGG